MVAYNKMDVPDSSDYWEDIRDALAAQGVPRDACFAIRCKPGAEPACAAAEGRGAREGAAHIIP